MIQMAGDFIRLHMVCLLAITSTSTVLSNSLNINRGVIIHLFEWKYREIAQECEKLLSIHGFAGVQVIPINYNFFSSLVSVLSSFRVTGWVFNKF